MKMKRWTAVLLTLALLLGCVPSVFAEDKLEIRFSDVTTQAGEEFTVTMSLVNNSGVYAFGASLSYDSDNMELLSATGKNVGTWQSLPKSENQGQISWYHYDDYKEDGEFLTLVFRMKDTAETKTEGYPITITLDPEWDEITNVARDLTYTIVPGTVKLSCKHDTELRNASPASCTESGYSGDLVCKLCEETIETGHEIAALGHDWIADDATHFHCSRCMATKSVLDLSGGSNAVQAEVIGDTASIVTDTAAGVGSSISLEALQTAVTDNGLRSVEISTGMGASAVVGGGKSGSAAITDAEGKVFFKAEAMGGQFRYDKKIKNGAIVGTYAKTGSKASAIDYVDIRLQYKMTLPEGVKLKDCTWSWELIYLEKSHPVTGSNFQSAGDGTNSYLSNVVLTNIPAASYADMEISALLTVSFTLDGVSYTMSQSVSSPLTRSIGSMNEYYKNTMYSSLSDEAKVYVNELSKYTEKVTPVA